MLAYKKVFSKKLVDGSLYDSKKNERVFRRLFFLFILYSLWTFFGGDNGRYDEFIQSGYKDFYAGFDVGIEPFYVFIANISGESTFIWKLIVYGLACYITYWTLRISKKDNYITILCFVIFSLPSYGSARAVLAYGALLLGFVMLNDGDKLLKKIIGVGFIIGSIFLHASMILPILLIPLAQFFKLNKFTFFSLLLLFPVVTYMIGILADSFVGDYFSFAGDYTVQKMENYMTSEKWSEEGSYYRSFTARVYQYLGWLFIIPSVFLSVFYCLKNKVNDLTAKIVSFSFYLTYISFAFYFSTLPIKEIVYGRYFTMVPFFIYLAIPESLYGSSNYNKYFLPLVWLGWLKGNSLYLISMYNQYFS